MNDRLPRIETTSCTASTTTNSSSSALDTPCAASTASDGNAKDSQTEPFQQNDVLLGRGKKFRNHPGNKRYTGKSARELLHLHTAYYILLARLNTAWSGCVVPI
jgi:hypothetical protein